MPMEGYIYYKKITGDYRCLCYACRNRRIVLSDNDLEQARLIMLNDNLAERDRLKNLEEQKQEKEEEIEMNVKEETEAS